MVKKKRSWVVRRAIDVLGFGLIILTPFLGWLPGPGGIPIFLAGLSVLALNHEWAENLLKNFDKKRIALTEEFLVKNPRISRTIDGLCITGMAGGLYLLTASEGLLLRLFGGGLVSFALIILISNQKRLDRFIAKIKKH